MLVVLLFTGPRILYFPSDRSRQHTQHTAPVLLLSTSQGVVILIFFENYKIKQNNFISDHVHSFQTLLHVQLKVSELIFSQVINSKQTLNPCCCSSKYPCIVASTISLMA